MEEAASFNKPLEEADGDGYCSLNTLENPELTLNLVEISKSQLFTTEHDYRAGFEKFNHIQTRHASGCL